MILDSIDNFEKYVSINPGFEKAFRFLKEIDAATFEGRFDIDGSRVYAFAVKAVGEGRAGAQLENHRKYIDIQFGVSGIHEFGWKPLQDCKTVTRPFDEGNDYGYFGDEPDVWIPLKPGQFVVFFPEDAHTPKGGTGALHKLLVKVAV